MKKILFTYLFYGLLLCTISYSIDKPSNCDSAWNFYHQKIDDNSLDDVESGRSRREQIIIELAKACKDERTIDKLISFLATDKNVNIRVAAATGLGIIGDKKAKKSLFSALNDYSIIVRLEAASSLMFLNLADTNVVTEILKNTAKGIGKEKWHVKETCHCQEEKEDAVVRNWRIYAANILTGINEKDAEAVITEMSNDKDNKIRKYAQKYLESKKNPHEKP